MVICKIFSAKLHIEKYSTIAEPKMFNTLDQYIQEVNELKISYMNGME